MSIRVVYRAAPSFPATDQHRDARRFGPVTIDGVQYWVDAIGDEPTTQEIAAVLAPPRRLVSRGTIIERLQAAGKLDAARSALDAAPLYDRERWNSRDAIYSDDPTALALLAAIGADPAAILAPEG